jgi:uridine phosphorylase
MNTSEPKRAWYLRCTEADVADRAVLVGDRGRVLLAAEMLDDARMLNEDRGLTTVTGGWNGTPVTVSAFGMGAAIAAVVLHELVSVGVRSAVRLGTALAVGETGLGDLVVADSALRGEGASGTYVPAGYPAAPDLDLTLALRQRSLTTGRDVRVGMIASYDGFYSELFADDTMPGTASVDIERLEALGVVGLDMETSAVLTVGRALGIRAGVLCLASVDGRSHKKLEDGERLEAERDLLMVGFDALCADSDVMDEENK